VSLLWRNHLRISLCPDRLVMGCYHRGLRVGKSKDSVIPVQMLPNAAEWRAAVDNLPEVLAAVKNHDFSLVLADQFVRYALLPFNPALKSAEQWMALARHRLTAVHGAAAAAWDIRLTETAPTGPRLACAVDRELVEEISAKFVAANARLVSVQPFLVAAFNRLRSGILSKIGNGSCWLVIEEHGRLTLAFIQRGTWIAIRSRRSDSRWRETLPEIIARESAFLALSEPCTRVIVCAQGAFDTEQYDAWKAEAISYRELALAWE
jgi:hypothetical protein